jgi:ABC-2 type transport system permease protein
VITVAEELRPSAFGYLIVRGARNRIASRLKRAKNPRYALAMAIGVAYFWFVYFQPLWLRHSTARRTPGIDATGPIWTVIGTAFLLVMAGIAWFVDNGPSNLALEKAEAAFILPAPVSRRGLIIYKVLRAQIAILTTVIVWTVLIRRGSARLPIPMQAIGVWLLFTTTNLHRTGAEIVKAAWWIRGGGALRKHWAATGVIILTIIGLAASIGLDYDALLAAWHRGVREWIVVFAAALASGPARVVLWPIHATLGPMVATSAAEWLAAIPWALLVLGVHLVWVTRVDEEAVGVAVDRATQRLEVLRDRLDRRKIAGRTARPTPAAILKTIPLASVGWPPMAIIWKNVLAMRRRTRNGVTWFVILALLPSGIGALMAMDGGSIATALALWGMIFAAEVAIAGPLLLRNDLRSDMINLTALKLLPLSGRTVVAAEILSAVMPLAAVESGMLVLSAIASQFANRPLLSPGDTVVVFVGGLPALVALNAALIGIQNAAPVLFPGWVKLDGLQTGGVEAMGQMVIVLSVFILLAIVVLLAPVVLASGIVYVLRARMAIGLAAGLLVGAAALAVEMGALILVLGRTFERTEPAEVAG